jgi:Holliday junction DNA helicase RuvA
MIAYLRGRLLESDTSSCVVETGGVGYLVQIPVSTFEKLPAPGGDTELFIRTQVREDAITLFGFAAREERNLFDLLISVNMVGGKLALAILGAMPVDTFCNAVNSGDVKMLSRIPGIGKRTAERLVVELRDKLASVIASGTIPIAGTTGISSGTAAAAADALAALEQLGFKSDAAAKVVRSIAEKLPAGEAAVENIIMLALAELNTNH